MDFARVLTETQVDRIDRAAEVILERTGVRVRDAEALRLCAARGANVDETSGIVRLPGPLLRETLALVPPRYTVAGLDGRTYEIGGGRPWGLAIVTDPWIIDYRTQRPRRPCLEDLRRHTAAAQQMEHVCGISCMDFPVTGVDGPDSSLRAWEMHLLNTVKHYHFIPAKPESSRQWEEIVRILAQDCDPAGMRLFTVHAPVISPLTVSGESVDLLRLACRYDAPVFPTICPMAGSTAPYSLAATLLLGHAENLFLAALTQFFRPGNPFLYAFGPSVTDMASAQDRYYTLDKVLWKTASVQLAHFRRMPVSAECGGAMPYRYDIQTGAEGVLFMLAAVASGADLLAGFGSGYNAIGMSAEMMAIQEAWMEAARFLERGIDTGDIHLGLDNIMKAGPGADFWTDSLTLLNLRGTEFFANGLFDSDAHIASESMLDRAHEAIEQRLAGYASPVPQHLQEELRRYFHDECAHLRSQRWKLEEGPCE